MGIVAKQSLRNTVITYLGFGIGAINTLFLFTNFLEDEYYGLVAFILSTANIMMPLMAFGVHNTLIKFYNDYKSKHNQNAFLTLMLILPLFIIIPVGLIGLMAQNTIAEWLSRENPIVGNYVWYIFFTAIAMAYFEVFFAWAKAQMKSVFGNFLKEVFHRVCIAIILIFFYCKLLTIDQFLIAIVFIYILRMVIMELYAFSLRWPSFKLKKLENQSAILKYAALIIIAGSIATVILDIDKFMIGQIIPIENVAYYSVAIYIATVIAVPQRAMHQIMSPLTAKFLSLNDRDSLEDLYHRSSLTLFIIGGLIFLLVTLNVKELYNLIASEYAVGVGVVLLVSIAKLYDNLLGNNNAMLFNSNYYRMVLLFGVILTVLAVIFNILLIPKYGIIGSAVATLLAVAIYNTIKLIYVNKKFKMQPIATDTIKTAVLIAVLFCTFYFWDFQFNTIVNIVLKSLLISIIYGLLIYKMKLSKDINEAVDKVVRR